MKKKFRKAFAECGYVSAWLVIFAVAAFLGGGFYALFEQVREPFAIAGIFIVAIAIANMICDWVQGDDGDDDSYYDGLY